MFSIEWLHNGAVVDTESSLLQTVEEVIETARLRRVSLGSACSGTRLMLIDVLLYQR